MKKIIIGIIFTSLCSCSSSDTDDSSAIKSNTTQTNQQPSNESTLEIPDSRDELNLISPVVNSSMPGIGTVNDMTPNELVENMTAGWNLGNHFDVPFEDKTTWGNPEPSKELIDKVKETGFNTIRIPVTWRTNQEDVAPYQIEQSYLERIQRVVDFAMQNNMYVLLNTHHDTDVFQPKTSTEAKVSERLVNTWLQIATYFKDYNEKLLFEILNEPRVQGGNEEWYAGNTSTRRVLNNLHKVAVDAIRSTGGNNAKRQLVISTWAGKTNDTAMNALVIPNNDPNIIITVHAYTPFDVSHDGARPWNGQNDLNVLRNDLNKIRAKWITENNRPVILGEWAMVNNNTQTRRSTTKQERVNYSEIYVREAKQRGMPTILWDDGGWYKALDRNTLEWDSQEQADVIIENSSN